MCCGRQELPECRLIAASCQERPVPFPVVNAVGEEPAMARELPVAFRSWQLSSSQRVCAIVRWLQTNESPIHQPDERIAWCSCGANGRSGLEKRDHQQCLRASAAMPLGWHAHRWSVRIEQDVQFFAERPSLAFKSVVPFQVANLDLDQIAAAKLAVDCKLKQSTVSNWPSRSRKKRIAQICFCVQERSVPTIFTAFHAARPGAAASYGEGHLEHKVKTPQPGDCG